MEELDLQKNVLHSIRQMVSNALKNSNNVSRLMTDKVEDYILLEEQPIPIKIGDRIIFIGTFTYENELRFWKDWIKLMSALYADKVNFDLLNNGLEMYKALKIHKNLFKNICKLLYKTIIKQQQYFYNNKTGEKDILVKWKNCSLRWLMKNITTEKLIQICMLVYIYNFDAEKKNLQILLGATRSTEAGEMYIYSWFQDLAGLTGKFVASQAPSIDSVFSDKQNNNQENKDG